MGRRIADHVQAILYVHHDDGKEYVHIFGGAEPELRDDADGSQWLRVDNLPRKTSVRMAVGDNAKSLTISHPVKPISRDGF